MSTPATETASPLDPVALAESLQSAAEKSAKVMGEFASRNASLPTTWRPRQGVHGARGADARQSARLAESQMNLWGTT
jgi:hypothetical protein